MSRIRADQGVFSGNQKLKRQISILIWITAILVFAVFLICSIQIRQNSNEELSRTGRFQAVLYEADDSQKQEFKNNPLISEIAKQDIESAVFIPELNDQGILLHKPAGLIGYADDEFKETAGLKLENGAWPDNQNEIAVERSALNALSPESHPGDSISLHLRDASGDESLRTYTLSGIVENYSDGYRENRNLIRFFTSEPADHSEKVHLFLMARDGYEDVFESLLAENPNLVITVSAKAWNEPFSAKTAVYSISILLILSLSGVLLFELMISWIYHHADEIRLANVLGIRESEIRRDYLKLIVKTLLIPAVLLDASVLLLGFGWIYILVITAFTAALLLINYCLIRTSLHFAFQNRKFERKQLPDRNRRTHSVRITAGEVRRRFLRSQHLWILVQRGLLIFVLSAVCYLAGTVFQSIHTIESYSKAPDFTLSGMPEMNIRYSEPEIYEQPGSVTSYSSYTDEPIPQEVLVKIENEDGLKIEDQQFVSNSSAVSWDHMDQSLLYDQNTQDLSFQRSSMVSMNEQGSFSLYPQISGLSDQGLIRSLKKFLKDEMIDWEAWNSGETVIMYLPLLSVSGQDGQDGLQPSWYGKKDPSLHKDSVLKVVSADGSESHPRLAAIIEDLPDDFPAVLPYTLITVSEKANRINIRLEDPDNQFFAGRFLTRLAEENSMNLQILKQAFEPFFRQEILRIILCLWTILILLSLSVMVLRFNRYAMTISRDQMLSQLKKLAIPDTLSRQIVRSADQTNILKLAASGLIVPVFFSLQELRKPVRDFADSPIPVYWTAFLIVLFIFIIVIRGRKNPGIPNESGNRSSQTK